MNQEKIEVELTVSGETDILLFHFGEEGPDTAPAINLNSSNSQQELKLVFSKLLALLQTTDVELDFVIADGYSKGLYKDVCREYIQDLNTEIKQVSQKIRAELKC